MSLLLALALAVSGLVGLALVPALSVQWALSFWFRPAERVPLDEAWLVRFERELALSGAVQQNEPNFGE